MHRNLPAGNPSRIPAALFWEEAVSDQRSAFSAIRFGDLYSVILSAAKNPLGRRAARSGGMILLRFSLRSRWGKPGFLLSWAPRA